MKKIVLLIICAALFSECSGPLNNSPEAVVASFIDAVRKGDIEELKKYISSQDVSLLQLGENFIGNLDSASVRQMKEKMSTELRNKTSNAKIDIKDEKIDGDNATVNVNFNIDGKDNLQSFLLLKENGVWKISMSSTGMKSAGITNDNLQEGMKQLNEGMKNMDGLKDSINKAFKKYKNINTDSLKKIIDDSKAEMDKLTEAVNQ